MFFHLCHEMSLQLPFRLQTQLPEAGLTFRTLLPVVRLGLVAANMDNFPGKQFRHLVQDIPKEVVDGIITQADHLLADAPGRTHFVSLAPASEVRISGQRGLRMPGHLDFGHDRNPACSCIGDYLPDLVLRIITAVRRSVVLFAFLNMPDQRLLPHRPYLCQKGVFPDLDPPTLIVGKMPMKRVEFVQEHHVDEGLYLLHGKKMPATVEHGSPVSEPRLVGDPQSGQPERFIAGLFVGTPDQHLGKGLKTPPDSGR